MKSYISINSKNLGKLLRRHKLTIKGEQEIIKTAQKSSIDASSLNRLVRKIEFKNLIRN